ncbi:MAG: DUF4190 domain-containing protein [Thermoplasmatota archaeon]
MPRQMKCPRCGTLNTIADGAKPICASCGFGGSGAPPAMGAMGAPAMGPPGQGASFQMGQPAMGGYPPGHQKTSGMAIAALVLGIVGLCPYIGIIVGLIALILGIVARKNIRQNPSMKGDGLALTGIILGAVGLAISVLVYVFAFTVVMKLIGVCKDDPSQCKTTNSGSPALSGDGARLQLAGLVMAVPVPGAFRLALHVL